MAIGLDTLNRQLGAIERDPLPSNVNERDQKRVANGEAEFVSRTYAEWATAARTARHRQQQDRIARPNAEIQKKLLLLERQEMGLLYRANVTKPRAYTPEEKAALENTLSNILIRYKRSQDLYPGGDGNLTAQDRAQIHELCQNFTLVAQALCDRNRRERNDDAWTLGFVKFCLRSCGLSGSDARHWVKIFVELPNEVDIFMGAFDKRAGAVDPQMLHIVERANAQGVNHRVLCLRIDGQDVQIQGPKDRVVSLRNRVDANLPDYTLTVQEIYNKVRGKRAGYFEVEVFQNGVLNWDAIQLGSTSANGLSRIDVTQRGWINNLPVWRILTADQVTERYHGQVHWNANLAHNERYGFAMCANREEASLNMVNTHGFFEVIIPQADGRFAILPFGFQPPTLPGTAVEKAEMILKTQTALLHYPDEGAVRSDRGQYREFFAITPGEFADLETFLGRFVTKAREGREIFQMTGTNCARHAQKVFDKVVGKRFYGEYDKENHRYLGGFGTIAQELLPGRDINGEIKRITKSLDEITLHRLSSDVGTRLVDAGDRQRMANLAALCLSTLSETLKEQAPMANLQMSEAAILERINALYQNNPQAADATMKNDLTQLIKLAIASQQIYKLPFFDAEFRENAILWGFYSGIRVFALDALLALLPTLDAWLALSPTVEWWLELPRWIAYCFFTCVLFLHYGAWRGYTYLRNDGTERTARVVTNPLNGRMLHLPAQAFNRVGENGLKHEWRQQVGTILGHFAANPPAAAPAAPEHIGIQLPPLVEIRA